MTKYAIVPVDYDGLIACKPPLDEDMQAAVKLANSIVKCSRGGVVVLHDELVLARALLRANGEDA